MSATDQLLENAQSYAASFDKGDLPLPPGRRVAIVACMDARLNPYALVWHIGRTGREVQMLDESGSGPVDADRRPERQGTLE